MGKQIDFFRIEEGDPLSLPFANEGIHAGFPSPAQDYMETGIDLNRELIRNPAATFFGRIKGESMRDAGVDDGDVIIVDRSLDPEAGDLAVCFLDGEFALKRYRREGDVVVLEAAHPDYPVIRVTGENDFRIWGVVTYTIKNNRRGR